jgi:hypothetical protein
MEEYRIRSGYRERERERGTPPECVEKKTATGAERS